MRHYNLSLATKKIIDKFWDELWPLHMKDTDKGLDFVAEFFDECFTAGNFDIVDEALFVGSDYRNFSTEIHVAVLAFSLPAKDKLPSRPKYVTMCAEVFTKRNKTPEQITGLMKGLK